MNDMTPPNICNELKDRFLKPWSILSFKLYFFIIIIIFGGIGVIVSIIKAIKEGNWEGIPLNLMTYSMALLVPSCIILFLQYLPTAKNKVSLVILIIAVLVGTSLITFTANIIVAIICMVLAWFFWIIANSDNTYLDDNAYDNSIKQDLNEHGKNWN